MPLFDYQGQLQSGAAFQGTLEADSQQQAEEMLADMGVRVTSLRAVKRAAYIAPLSLDDFLFFNEQVAAMTRAGVPLAEGLRQLAADVGSGKLKRLLVELADELTRGTQLEQALERMRNRFPTQYAGVVQAGLKSGDLGGTLYGLAAHLRLKSGLRRALMEISVYPAVVLLFAFGLVTFLMRAVVPEFKPVFVDFGLDPDGLPGLTRLLFAVSSAWPTVESTIFVILIVLAAVAILLSLPAGQAVRERLLRHIPGIAQVYWSSVLARFTHTSALAAFSGVPLPELIATAGAASGSTSLAGTARRVAEKLNTGAPLAETVEHEPDIPSLWTSVVSITAARGELPAALEELARVYEQRARYWGDTLRIVFGPVLLVVLGTIVGMLLAGLLLPLTHLIQGLAS